MWQECRYFKASCHPIMSIHSLPRIEALLAHTIRVKWIITTIITNRNIHLLELRGVLSSYLNLTLLVEKEHNVENSWAGGFMETPTIAKCSIPFDHTCQSCWWRHRTLANPWPTITHVQRAGLSFLNFLYWAVYYPSRFPPTLLVGHALSPQDLHTSEPLVFDVD